MPRAEGDATVLLSAVSKGDQSARNKLFSILYKELHALSHKAMRKENVGHILQTTALINEAYLKLVKSRDVRWRNRNHFFSVAARAMRHILVSEARRRHAAKRGRGRKMVPLHKVPEPGSNGAESQWMIEDLEALDGALDRLAEDDKNSRMLTVLELHFFAGLSQAETAEVLGVSRGTVRRDWQFAKVWLYQDMVKAEGRAP